MDATDDGFSNLADRQGNKGQLSAPLASFPALHSPQRLDVLPGRKKVPLVPGHSPMDWANLQKKAGNSLRRLGNDGSKSNGAFQLERYSVEEVASHCKKDDCWIALQGKVYNVTAYVPFHPGGAAQLLRGAGKDATALFQQTHPWVNFERILENCWVGYLVKQSHLDLRVG